MAAIQLDGVTKHFGAVTALQTLDLTVERGEIFGFLGPNGAGKSTAIDVMLDYVRPDAGTASVLGLDSATQTVEIRRRTGILPDGYAVFPAMTGYDHLEFAIEAVGADDDPDALLDRVGLTPAEGAREAESYSKGMAQRLTLAVALVGEPDLLVLDEPTTGLDPGGARRMREIIEAEADRGATVFFSSHILAQVEAVCDRVGILRNGQCYLYPHAAHVAVQQVGDARQRVAVQDILDRAYAGLGAVLPVQIDTRPDFYKQRVIHLDLHP